MALPNDRPALTAATALTFSRDALRLHAAASAAFWAEKALALSKYEDACDQSLPSSSASASPPVGPNPHAAGGHPARDVDPSEHMMTTTPGRPIAAAMMTPAPGGKPDLGGSSSFSPQLSSMFEHSSALDAFSPRLSSSLLPEASDPAGGPSGMPEVGRTATAAAASIPQILQEYGLPCEAHCLPGLLGGLPGEAPWRALPATALALVSLADAHIAAGDHARAAGLLQSHLHQHSAFGTLSPLHWSACSSAGVLAGGSSPPGGSHADQTSSLALHPSVRYRLALCLFQQKSFTDVLDLYNPSLFPSSPVELTPLRAPVPFRPLLAQLQFLCGAAELALGRPDASRAHLLYALAIWPLCIEAVDALIGYGLTRREDDLRILRMVSLMAPLANLDRDFVTLYLRSRLPTFSLGPVNNELAITRLCRSPYNLCFDLETLIGFSRYRLLKHDDIGVVELSRLVLSTDPFNTDILPFYLAALFHQQDAAELLVVAHRLTTRIPHRAIAWYAAGLHALVTTGHSLSALSASAVAAADATVLAGHAAATGLGRDPLGAGGPGTDAGAGAGGGILTAGPGSASAGAGGGGGGAAVALDHFRRARDLDANFAAVWVAIGHVFSSGGDADRARRAYGCAAVIQRGSHEAWLHAGAASLHLGDLVRARRAISFALASAPGPSGPVAGLDPRVAPLAENAALPGSLLARAPSLAASPPWAGDFTALNEAAVLATADHDLDKAEAYSQAATQAATACGANRLSAASCWLNLGHILRLKGEYHRARAALEQALLLNPRHARAHACLGLVCQKLGLPAAAAASYHRALAYRPDSLGGTTGGMGAVSAGAASSVGWSIAGFGDLGYSPAAVCLSRAGGIAPHSLAAEWSTIGSFAEIAAEEVCAAAEGKLLHAATQGRPMAAPAPRDSLAAAAAAVSGTSSWQDWSADRSQTLLGSLRHQALGRAEK
ncbi:hypothetical protein H696_02317 [Fonticula alba]|uniref:Uncharacterized protein n=1 Tax=Fonticula alba TaxID=691883 RepID=A0A058ZAI1_FONAL|nr:hypothetical protein H696_02317 [Fonticula alba]KCV71365.1 hypothetical protein H696_02317 [Fonticula alba]|eukprot:XP_009494488.1 hypothetical protein H696_02317 [Fonticula alba]